MSRLAKKPITLPPGVFVKKEGDFWIFKGPKGELRKSFSDYVNIEERDGAFLISLKNDSIKNAYAMLGTTAALFKNCVDGVQNGFEKKLEIEGVGYRAQIDGKDLVLSLGFSHPVKIQAPEGITFKVEKNTITINGVDKEKTGLVAAKIRAEKKPEPYKGKGIHYMGEVIRRKAGKKAVSTA
ncbi:50S ribosomal protein L6 [Candidatus Giovannonibacteria bacterium RIFCSPLOWO2_01_FULL_43_160]|uniref:Large ribosomal subunit protein uL6 n=2 Tax=Candidatus Giovannoniibacteriota TaxID=1752738 RepID=A0A0G1IWU8_9BACT|nr:MAG: 50S ribosomal protein L6 [Candidatus Giovannonibacteria bacterium GW2011_GWB1_43_13]KKS99859.1 MAG: 50S ribosomal protein L6 [Candidatus Giovannonibacteria bacterium GW2011_GWA1_43_15]KKT21043.1 MAG: 50S ribosomal protein L6 [Candidatus Giovannonibacteria bacterium GW2011_GWC2_43_8]KKT63560.1 MAG: 50S ribosomal protein L6 [Candidatus Giovannonibacteria bacterium GW2011_GWA2_44_26]OGF58565.1 MAG: 50S ribosomal protein L6 [Candidatus Giovannonibacteria bacterium RIFCSPHIGHO2_01_FULL_43_14